MLQTIDQWSMWCEEHIALMSKLMLYKHDRLISWCKIPKCAHGAHLGWSGTRNITHIRPIPKQVRVYNRVGYWQELHDTIRITTHGVTIRCSISRKINITIYLAGSHSIEQDFLSLVVVGNGRLSSSVSVSLPALQTAPNSHTTHCARTHTRTHTHTAYKKALISELNGN